ncbi:hypothetical protein M405DRAFT_864141 [Rhizopogon salebrosus TDB-379]|nr:hypothetical protein M405DRAFT_864141 [Rhizopogon salebrosus TDB-379]
MQFNPSTGSTEAEGPCACREYKRRHTVTYQDVHPTSLRTSDPASKRPHPSGTVEMTAKRPRLTLRIHVGCGDPAVSDLNPPQASICGATSQARQQCQRGDRAPSAHEMLPPKCSMLEGLMPLDENAVTVKEPSPAPWRS